MAALLSKSQLDLYIDCLELEDTHKLYANLYILLSHNFYHLDSIFIIESVNKARGWYLWQWSIEIIHGISQNILVDLLWADLFWMNTIVHVHLLSFINIEIVHKC